MKRNLEILVLSGALLANSRPMHSTLYAADQNQDKRTRVLQDLLKGDPYTKETQNDQEWQMLKKVHDNPMEGNYIEDAMKKGINHQKIYDAITYGLINLDNDLGQKMERESKNAELPNGELKQEFQQLLWQSVRVGMFMQEVFQRGIAATKSPVARDTNLSWYLTRIGYK